MHLAPLAAYDIAGIPLATLTPSALLGICILAIITGRLVPRRTYDDKVHEANEWRTESRLKDAQIAEKDEQLGHLAEVGRTVEQLARGLQQEIRP